MKTLTVFLIAAALSALECEAVLAASQPIDPDRAPIAAVDRYSDSAGTLLRRSADTRLPGPNEPIDFDRPPLTNLGFSPTGEPTLYYRLDVQSTTPAPVYILYFFCKDEPFPGHLTIFLPLPLQKVLTEL